MTSDAAGRIIKATAGFYYVYLNGKVLECRARGLFRKDGRIPYVGDRVTVAVNEDGSGTIQAIHSRKNVLARPPLANLDYVVVVLSVTDPVPNLQVTDKFLAMLEYKEIEPLIAVTKCDLEDPEPLQKLYQGAGYQVFLVDSVTGRGAEALATRLQNAFAAFSGNSGVGKSSLLNAIDPGLAIQVGNTSKKLGRGRHTTRHVEIFPLPGGGFVADTPGFSSLSLVQLTSLSKEELADCFREFRPFVGDCRFRDCAHTCEAGCAVLTALEEGKIASSRHQSYMQLYGELRKVKEWERR